MPHLGDPCIHCGIAQAEADSGDCSLSLGLAGHVRSLEHLKRQLDEHKRTSDNTTSALITCIQREKAIIFQAESNLDAEKIALAESVMQVGIYGNGGDERDSARQDAIRWFAGEKVGYRGLKIEYFGTKNYERWRGQRSDHEYGYGPKHGGTCFSIGLREEARKRDLTDEENEACIYYLLNLIAIQEAQEKAKAA